MEIPYNSIPPLPYCITYTLISIPTVRPLYRRQILQTRFPSVVNASISKTRISLLLSAKEQKNRSFLFTVHSENLSIKQVLYVPNSSYPPLQKILIKKVPAVTPRRKSKIIPAVWDILHEILPAGRLLSFFLFLISQL